MNGNLAIIGDVHGEPQKLERILNRLDSSETSRTLIFTGDYVDRGPGSKDVLDILCALKSNNQHFVFLRGNHEQYLLDFLLEKRVQPFLVNGGLATIRSYAGAQIASNAFDAFRQQFPLEHLRFLENTETFFENNEVLVSHSGIDPNDPGSRAPEAMILGSFPNLFTTELPFSKKLIVAGHYAQSSLKHFESARFVCVDSGCGTFPDAPLSALLLPERRVVTTRGPSPND